MPLAPRALPGGGRSGAQSWRRVAQVASAVLLAFCVAGFLAARQRGRPAPAFDAEEAAEIEEFVSPFESIKESFKPDIRTVDGAFTGGECDMEESEEGCPISNMTRDLLTGVYPGGETRCLLGDAPYLFQVIPGDLDKLVLYFQGGGACWDASTASAGLCVRAVADEGRVGIFDKTNPANPYINYTIVIIGYCSGDAHVGHADHDWAVVTSLSMGQAKQRGYINARSAVDWTKRNLGGQTLDSLIITGSSAGALGTQIWSRALLGEFSYRAAAVIADSYAAIFPVGVQGGMMKSFGMCNNGLLTNTLSFFCNTGTVDVQRIFERAMWEYPKVAFANLDSKIDFVQIAFYKVVHKSRLGYMDHVGPRHFASLIMSEYDRYNMKPNWVSYSVNCGQHMYLNNDVMYQTSPVGDQVTTKRGAVGKFLSLTGNEISGDETPLVDWLAEFPVREGRRTETRCAGLKPKPPAPSAPAPSGGGLLGIFARHVHTVASVAEGVTKTALSTGVTHVASQLGFELSCSPMAAGKTFRP